MSLINEENGQTYTRGEFCDHVNTYFASIGNKLANIILQKCDNFRPMHNYALNIESDGITNFILYVNDLLRSLTMDEEENIIMYTDDTVLYTNHKYPLLCVSRSQNLFDLLYKWCHTNKLTILNETKHMFIASKKSQEKNVSVCNIYV